MGDIRFQCMGCTQSLVVDERGAGMAFQCPHCARPQNIPMASTHLPEEEPAAPGPPQGPDGLWMAQERIWRQEHQFAEQAVALVEREQRISALTAERDWLVAQLDEERARRQALEPELDRTRQEWSAAEKRAGEFEGSSKQNALRLQQVRVDLDQLVKQLDLVKAERSDAVLELTGKQEQFAEISLQMEKVQAERLEFEKIANRSRAELERQAAQLAELQAHFEQSAAEGDRLQSDLVRARAELGVAAGQLDKLQAVMKEEVELADYVQAKVDRDRLEGELRETQVRMGDLREKLTVLSGEREALRRERTELNLKIAALRDANHDAQLEQDNEVLRRMVERLNEEMKEFRPLIAKKKRREEAGGVVGELAKAALARCFVDPERI